LDEDLAEVGLRTVEKMRVSYADARLVDIQTESVLVKNGILEDVKKRSLIGIGVRALVE